MTDCFSSGISLNSLLLGLYTLRFDLRRNLLSPLHVVFVWLLLVVQYKVSKHISHQHTPPHKGNNPCSADTRIAWCNLHEDSKHKSTDDSCILWLLDWYLSHQRKSRTQCLGVLRKKKKKKLFHHVWFTGLLSCKTWAAFLEHDVAYECLHSCSFCGFSPVSRLGWCKEVVSKSSLLSD